MESFLSLSKGEGVAGTPGMHLPLVRQPLQLLAASGLPPRPLKFVVDFRPSDPNRPPGTKLVDQNFTVRRLT